MLNHHQNRKARWKTRWVTLLVTLLVKGIAVTLTGFCSLAFAAASDPLANSVDIAGVGNQTTSATTVAGEYIAWREWIIDSPELAGFALNGSDGLVVGDLDNDGREDIVSVHESDSEYDSSQFDPDYIPDSEGHVRIAFAGATPSDWVNVTLAEGADSPAPEDADIADVNGDGFLDVIVAAELSHLIYLQNPGPDDARRGEAWERLILPMTKGNGSYIRVFFADLDGDNTPEVIAANKGAQRPGPSDLVRSTPVSIFSVTGDPLVADAWHETVLGRYSVPQNAQPVDLDADGDLDIVVGSRGENRLAWFENHSSLGQLSFIEHAIGIVGGTASGFNLEYADLNNDGRTDIIGAIGTESLASSLGWLEQPKDKDSAWIHHPIGSLAPDAITGIVLTDIDGDGDSDAFVGSYSSGPREGDGEVKASDALGRLAWFENPGATKVISSVWPRHDVSRRKRGMFDKFIARDIDGDGDIDLLGTRGNSAPFDGVFWLEQQRAEEPSARFTPARQNESPEMPLP